MSKASVFTISPDRPFLDDLVEGLLADPRFGIGDDPAALAGVRIFLPTRRACRSLAEGFVRANGGRPLLLPRITPLGDIDEDELAFQPDAAGSGHDRAVLIDKFGGKSRDKAGAAGGPPSSAPARPVTRGH